MANKIQFYSQLANDTAVEITESHEKWLSFLDTAARIYKYPYHEQLLIYAQRPDATACASFDVWNQHMRRYIKRGAQGIALLDTSGDNPKIKYVFDVADTAETEHSRSPNLWQYRNEHEQSVRNALDNTYRVGGITFADQLEETARFEIDDYWYANKDDILRNLDGSMLLDYDSDTIRQIFCEAAMISTSYVLLKRCGIEQHPEAIDFMAVQDFNTPGAVFGLGCAVSSTSESILRQIELAVKSYDKEKDFERSKQNEQSDLHQERRLSTSRTDTLSASAGTSGQVRTDEEELSERKPSGSLEQPDPQREIVSPSEGNGQSRPQQAQHNSELTEGKSRRDRGSEAERPHEMGGTDEHSADTGRGSNSEGNRLRITDSAEAQTSFFPSVNEQLEYLTQTEDAVVAPSAFHFPEAVIDQIYRVGSNTENHRMAIASEFSKGKGIESNAEFLKRIYHGGNGIVYDGTSVCVWYSDEAIRITGSKSARHARIFQAVNWDDAARRIDDLLKAGEFATKVELAEAPGFERKQLAETLWYMASDLSKDGIDLNLLPTVRNLHGGFPQETELLSGFLNDTLSIASITTEVEHFITVYNHDPSVLRFHYHKPDQVLESLHELTIERVSYESRLTDIPRAAYFITEDELESGFMRGSGMAGGKDRIVDYFEAAHSMKEKADFLKAEYGIGGRSHALSGAAHSDENHDSKGIVFRKEGCADVSMSWEKAARRIDDMIRQNRYLSKTEATQRAAIRDLHDPRSDIAPESAVPNIEGSDMNSIPAEIESTEVIASSGFDNSPFVQQVMADAEKINREEKMADPAYQLATELDSFAYDFDTYDYNDRIQDRDAEIERIFESIKDGNIDGHKDWLLSILAGPDAENAEKAYNLMERLDNYALRTYEAANNPYSLNELDRMQIQEVFKDGTKGDNLGYCRTEKAPEYVEALNNRSITADQVRQILKEDAHSWHCYVIEDLSSWNPIVAGDRSRTPIKFFDTYEQARDYFLELRSNAEGHENIKNPETGEPLARLTIGIQRESPASAADLIQVRNNRHYLVDDFTRMTAISSSPEAMDILERMHRDLGFDRIRRYEKDAQGIYSSPVDMPFSDWENTYFSRQPEQQRYRVNESNYIDIQTCDDGYDYTIYNSETHAELDGGVLTATDISMVSAVREVCVLHHIPMNRTEPITVPLVEKEVLSETSEIVISAMEAAGFTRSNEGAGIRFSDAAGYPLEFTTWENAYEWLDTASFKDTPEIRGRVQAILHTDREFAQSHLIPGETEFFWDERKFQVESVDLDGDSVELRDITFQGTTGFPIFRVEHIGAVRSHLENIVEHELPKTTERSNIAELPPNYRITDAHLGEGGPKSKFIDNVRAIELLKNLELENRQASPDEQEILARYVGWGGIPEAFDPGKPAWKQEYEQLKDLLTPQEYESAKSSTLNAHYTSPVIIKAMYDAVQSMGFKEGNILEPAMGTGNFFGVLPPEMENSRLHGVELDSISGRIAQQLYPRAEIKVAGFETTDRKDSFDLVVGNVPFGNYQVNDRAYNSMNLSIHNYFIVKSIDQVRPGGIVAVVTSRFTMDAKNSSARRIMAQRAELIGALRLPNDAFKRNAGAEVVADVLFFQKRDRPMEIEPDWVQSTVNEQGHRVNNYFMEHPEMVLGTQSEHSTAHGMDYTVEPIEGVELSQQLQTAISMLGGIYREAELPRLDDAEITGHSIPADPDVKNYSYTVLDGEVYFRENSIMIQPEISESQKARIKALVEVRNVLNDLITYQVEDYPDADIQSKQAELNTVYDSFTAKYGLINSKANEKAFSEDSSYYLLSALEYIDEDGRLEKKADMFYKRTIRAEHKVERVSEPNDALVACIGEKGRVDLSYMSQLLGGEDISHITDALQGAIYRDPSLPDGQQWITADEYLSGNVREKLAIAEKEAQNDPTLSVNVQALKEAQPTPLEATEIDVRLGATWVDPEYIQQFMNEVFQTPFYRRYKVKVEYSPVTGEWKVGEKGVGWGNDVLATSTYGTTRATAYQILEDSLNLRDVRINDYIEVDGKKKTVLNQRETTLAAQKQQAIADAFSEWIWKDPQRRNALVSKYNELYNSCRPREYDGSHIVFSGMNPSITLRAHQLNAIAHILYGPNTLLAHEVGAGKSFEMIGAAMECKRLGLCQKSLFVVPNHLTLQWANEFLRLYPAAHLLVTSKRDFEPANRKKFCGRIATGDYDAVIIGQSQFEMIPVSPERQQKTIEAQLQEVEDAIYDQRWSGKSFTVKQLEKTKKSLEARLEKLTANERKDDVIYFEQLGVDRLFVDESQAYKNLYFHTKMRNVAGLSTSESQRSSDMYMKCRYMDEITGGRGIIFASGTPISNSMAEMYTLMRYLQHDTLMQHNLNHFDAWASTFGQTSTAIELAPEGTGYRARTRFSKFFNLPELMTMFKETADIKTSDQLDLPVPKAIYETIVVKPSEQQKELVKSLSERAAEIHAGNVDPSIDNMLKITSDGKKIGLDQRLINPILPDDPGSKVNACVNRVFNIWEEGSQNNLTQMIFCDMSTPSIGGKKKENTFNVYDDIREKLIGNGIPESEIAFIHEAKTETQKKDLFTKVRTGQVRILMGSTEKMGAGTNCQDLLIAVHHLDVPWRPSDMIQRNGRIIRQGNTNDEVKVFQYVTEGTFDSYLYQTLENKQKFISQVMSAKSPVRSCEDMDEAVLSYAEIKALCAGNPLIKEKMDLDIQVGNLQTLKASYKSEHYRLEDKLLTFYPREIHSCEEFISNCKKDIELSTLTSREDFPGITISGINYTEKKEAGLAIIDACKRMSKTDQISIGTYRGFDLELSFNSFAQEFAATLKGSAVHTAFLSNDPFGNLTRLDNAIAHIPERLQAAGDRLADLKEQQKAAELELQKPFSKEEELRVKSARLAELNVELDMNAKHPQQEQKSEEDRSNKNLEKTPLEKRPFKALSLPEKMALAKQRAQSQQNNTPIYTRKPELER